MSFSAACETSERIAPLTLFERSIEEHHIEDEVVLSGSFCIGKCNRVGVTVQINDDVHVGVTRENFREFFKTNVLDVIEKEGK